MKKIRFTVAIIDCRQKYLKKNELVEFLKDKNTIKLKKQQYIFEEYYEVLILT